MKTNSIDNNEIYHLKKRNQFQLIVLISLFFVLGIFLNLNINEFGQKILSNAIEKSNCPVGMEDMQLNIFPPGISLSKVSIPANCYKGKNDILLKNLNFQFWGFNLSPIGILFKISFDSFGSKIVLKQSVGMGNFLTRIENLNLPIKNILGTFTEDLQLNGNIKFNLSLESNLNGPSEGVIQLISKDLQIPSQSIQGLELFPMEINHLMLKAKLNGGKKLKVEQLILGDTNAHIRSEFSGNININPALFRKSELDLKGQVHFSDKFINHFMLIKLLFQKFNHVDGFYQLKLGGTLENPVPSST